VSQGHRVGRSPGRVDAGTQCAQRLERKVQLFTEIDRSGGGFTRRFRFGYLLILGRGIVLGGIIRLRDGSQDENPEQCQTGYSNAGNHGCSFANKLRDLKTSKTVENSASKLT